MQLFTTSPMGPVRRVAALLLVSQLAACASTPLPPWLPIPGRNVVGQGNAQSSAPLAAAGAAKASQGVESTPVPPRGVSGVSAPVMGGAATPLATSATTVPGRLAPQLFSDAVADRFPAPPVTYLTPGLQAGRQSFTTGAELNEWLQMQASTAAGTPGLAAAVKSIGRSQRGETLVALVLARAASSDAATVSANGRPTVLLLGQPSADEPAVTEALLVMARELAQGGLKPMLDRLNVLIVPRVSPDTVIPSSSGAGARLAVIQDHLLLSTPEAQAVAALVRDYRPAVVVDVREYEAIGRTVEQFRAVQKYDALFQYATTANTPSLLTRAAHEWFRLPLLAALKSGGLSSEWVYTLPASDDDRKLSMAGPQPDTVRNVSALKHSIGLLLETRGAGLGRMHIQRRVHTHVTGLSSILSSTAQRASELAQLRPYFDREVSALACTGQAVVLAAPTAAQYDIQMLDAATGADRTVTVDWDSSLALTTVIARARPCGYWLAPSAGAAAERLRLHGVTVQRLVQPATLLGDNYQDSRPLAGGSGAISTARALVDVPSGSYYVPLNQPLAHLVIAALEPETPFSYLTQGLVGELPSITRVMTPPVAELENLP